MFVCVDVIYLSILVFVFRCLIASGAGAEDLSAIKAEAQTENWKV